MNRHLTRLALLAALCLPARAGDRYEVDPVHAVVMFRIKHLQASFFYGRFNKVEGSFVLDADPAKCRFEVRVDPASVDTNNAKRDQHVKGPDLFNVEEFPELAFVSKRVVQKDPDTWTVTGELTFHGVTREVSVEVDKTGEGDDPMGGHRAGLECVFTINRSDFGVTAMVGPLGDEVRLMVTVEGVRQ